MKVMLSYFSLRMSFDDFVRYFSRLELCHLGPESIAYSPGPVNRRCNKRQWEMICEEGEWLRNSTAGGCSNFPNTFYMNPQFHVEVVAPDESDTDGNGTLVVGLMQKGLREKHIEPHVIGYSVFRMPPSAPNNRLLDRRFFMTNSSVARSPVFINMREVCGRHKLKPGHYVIIPCTFNPNEEAKFMLRIFSEQACGSNSLIAPKCYDTAKGGESHLSLSKCAHMATRIQPLSRKSYSPPFRGTTVVYQILRMKNKSPMF
ncbi:calpain 2, (m II) large subunit, variant 5 [Schistosoma haematobium]|uniref:Calpain 2, (M II) large subunit, variant 5 n=1 Tax=Schistosoma haematobium TaxID=6185 RepID=A0A922LUE4_SCHHA|nr:calpain 2, (m II) large subunit, variant 5 [Schistosoma haematobium]KAH9593857.1 calpain 2, (m II) large subunit, variant 5 [Schistosoma haematobium]